MSNYTTPAFWAASFERALKTAAQTAIALIGTDQVGILSLDWAQIGSVTATTVVLSLLTSIAGGGSGSGPSFTRAEEITAKGDDGPNVVGHEALFDDQDEVVDGDDDLETLAAEEVDATPPPGDYRPRH